jgi:hypothetical protein
VGSASGNNTDEYTPPEFSTRGVVRSSAWCRLRAPTRSHQAVRHGRRGRAAGAALRAQRERAVTSAAQPDATAAPRVRTRRTQHARALAPSIMAQILCALSSTSSMVCRRGILRARWRTTSAGG